MSHERNGEQQLEAERTEREPNEVVRVVLFQSRSVESIPDDADLDAIYFTNSVWAVKGGDAVNAGQVMPVGGRVSEGEKTLTAALRECVEETHLRPPERSLRKLSVVQEYSFQHPRHGEVQNRAHFYKGKLASPDTDIPYVLDPEEDKIEGFVTFSPAEMRELFEFGEITKDGRAYTILDSLSPDAMHRAGAQTEVNEEQRSQVTKEIMMHHLLTDARKKLMVLFGLQRVKFMDQAIADEGFDLWNEVRAFSGGDVEQAQDIIDRIDRFWSKTISTHGVTADHVKTAFSNSEFGSVISNAQNYEIDDDGRYKSVFDIESGRGLPTIDLIFPLLIEGGIDQAKLRTLIRQPEALRLLKMMNSLQKTEEAFQQETGRSATTGELIAALKSETMSVNKERVPLLQFELIGKAKTAEGQFMKMGENIDKYFLRLQTEAGLAPGEAPIDQLEAVKKKTLPELVDLAAGKGSEFEVMDKGEARILRWEARRKLVLMLLLNDAMRVRETAVELGIEQVTAIENKVFTNGINDRYGPVDVLGRPDDSPKDLMSLLRKIIVRDQTLGLSGNPAQVAKDIFARSYVIEGATAADMEDRPVPLPEEAVVISAKGEDLDMLEAPQPVADIIMGLLREGQGEVEIIGYKPLPKSGEKIVSQGPGGGGDVRYAKFIIKHTDAEKVQRYREVQIYLPQYDEEGRQVLSAHEELGKKKADDRRYGVARLFGTKGTRSFMELMFPKQIYTEEGHDIRPMYRKRAQ